MGVSDGCEQGPAVVGAEEDGCGDQEEARKKAREADERGALNVFGHPNFPLFVCELDPKQLKGYLASWA